MTSLASELAELQALSEKATTENRWWGLVEPSVADAAYIAACSPDRIQRVLARLRKCEEALRQIQQRCNESGPSRLGERETIYSVHAIARAALEDEI